MDPLLETTCFCLGDNTRGFGFGQIFCHLDLNPGGKLNVDLNPNSCNFTYFFTSPAVDRLLDSVGRVSIFKRNKMYRI